MAQPPCLTRAIPFIFDRFVTPLAVLRRRRCGLTSEQAMASRIGWQD
jgi:hypothetical protein